MQNIRMSFTKYGRAKYISHLDLARCFSRAFARTDIPVWYTEGFNPHIYLTFPLPLPLGVESKCESFEFRLADSAYPLSRAQQQLQAVLPEGIEVFEVRFPQDTAGEIAKANYQLVWSGQGMGEKAAQGFWTCMERPQILVQKKTKRQQRELDLKPLVTVLKVETANNYFEALIQLPAGNELNINPLLLAGALKEYGGMPDDSVLSVQRTAILKADLTPFV